MPLRKRRLSRFWQKLKHRKVIRVLAYYAGIGIVVIELANNVAEPLNLPEWLPRMIILLVIVGIPIAAFISWFYDYDPGKIRKGKSLDSRHMTHSIAVLPFQNMSPDKEQDYFCEGIAEEIINALSHISAMKVIARTSSFAFRNQHLDVRDIGKQLNVDYLLEGSVRKAGSRLRITAQLIRLDDGTHLYSERFDRDVNDVFAIQDEITQAIVDRLRIKLVQEEKAVLFRRYTENVEVFNLYLLGRHHNYRFTEEDAGKAKGFFEAALEIDPDYSPAYVGLGLYFTIMGGGGLNIIPPGIAMPRSKELLHRAIELDPGFAEAHSNLSFIYNMYDLEWKKGKHHAQRAIELDPNNAEVQRFYAWYLTIQGHPRLAIEKIQLALELDPLQALSYQNAAAHYYFARDFSRSLEFGEKTLKLNPHFSLVRINMGMSYIQMGNMEKAIEVLENLSSYPGISESYLSYAYAACGQMKRAEELKKDLHAYYEKGLVSASGLALAYLGLGEKRKAMDLAEASLDEKPANSWHTAFLLSDPIWDELRTEEHFKRICKHLGS